MGDGNGRGLGAERDAHGPDGRRRAVQDVKELRVWQQGIDLCKAVYEATKRFPPEERLGLTSQMRRAAVAIPSNVAEGRARGSRKEYRQFVIIGRGSAAELETQIIIAQELGLLAGDVAEGLLEQVRQVGRMLSSLARSLAETDAR